MGCTREALFRPIEITSANNGLTITGTGAVSADTGVYGGLPMLLWELTDICGAAYTWSLDSTDGYKVKVVGTSGNFDVTFTETPLRDLLGFTANLTGAATYTATNYPQFSFIPSFGRSNLDAFWLDRNVVRGTNAHSGAYSGVSTGRDNQMKRLEFPLELAERVADEFGLSAYDKDSNWSTFEYGCRTVQATAAANPSPKGFYLFPDVDDAVSGIQSMDSGGLTFKYTSSPDTYVFCQPKGSIATPSAGIPNSRIRYDISCYLTTADAPTWVTLS